MRCKVTRFRFPFSKRARNLGVVASSGCGPFCFRYRVDQEKENRDQAGKSHARVNVWKNGRMGCRANVSSKNNKRLPDGRKCKVWLRVGRQDNCKSETLGQKCGEGCADVKGRKRVNARGCVAVAIRF